MKVINGGATQPTSVTKAGLKGCAFGKKKPVSCSMNASTAVMSSDRNSRLDAPSINAMSITRSIRNGRGLAIPQMMLTLLRIEPNTPMPATNSPSPAKPVRAGLLVVTTSLMKFSTNDTPSLAFKTGICAKMPSTSLCSKFSIPMKRLESHSSAMESGNIDMKP